MSLRGVFFIKSRKIKILAVTYSIALIAAMGFYGYIGNRSLEGYRLAAGYSAGRAFEETVHAVENLSRSLKKSLYATDSAMRAKLCGEIYADAAAAESAMSTLPFTTHELEQLSSFLNVAGDYAYSLSANSEEGFDSAQIDILTDFSGLAAEFADTLREIQSGLNNGDIMMDSREKSLINVGLEDSGAKLSEKLLEYEQSIGKAQEIEYEGKYSKKQAEEQGKLTEDEMKALAAEFAGVSPEALKLEYEYEGSSGRQCYSVDGLLICVSPSGVETMGQSRLVSELRIELEEAERRAKSFLEDRGYEDLQLSSVSENGAVALMVFSKQEGDAVYLSSPVKIAIALDDGSVYSFNAEDYKPGESGLDWDISQTVAEESLPDSLSLEDCRKVIMDNAAGEAVACYELSCRGENGETVTVYVNADSGKQTEIKID